MPIAQLDFTNVEMTEMGQSASSDANNLQSFVANDSNRRVPYAAMGNGQLADGLSSLLQPPGNLLGDEAVFTAPMIPEEPSNVVAAQGQNFLAEIAHLEAGMLDSVKQQFRQIYNHVAQIQSVPNQPDRSDSTMTHRLNEFFKVMEHKLENFKNECNEKDKKLRDRIEYFETDITQKQRAVDEKIENLALTTVVQGGNGGVGPMVDAKITTLEKNFRAELGKVFEVNKKFFTEIIGMKEEIESLKRRMDDSESQSDGVTPQKATNTPARRATKKNANASENAASDNGTPSSNATRGRGRAAAEKAKPSAKERKAAAAKNNDMKTATSQDTEQATPTAAKAGNTRKGGGTPKVLDTIVAASEEAGPSVSQASTVMTATRGGAFTVKRAHSQAASNDDDGPPAKRTFTECQFANPDDPHSDGDC